MFFFKDPDIRWEIRSWDPKAWEQSSSPSESWRMPCHSSNLWRPRSPWFSFQIRKTVYGDIWWCLNFKHFFGNFTIRNMVAEWGCDWYHFWCFGGWVRVFWWRSLSVWKQGFIRQCGWSNRNMTADVEPARMKELTKNVVSTFQPRKMWV